MMHIHGTLFVSPDIVKVDLVLLGLSGGSSGGEGALLAMDGSAMGVGYVCFITYAS